MPPPVYLLIIKPSPLLHRFYGKKKKNPSAYKERHGWMRRVASNSPVTSTSSAAGGKISRGGGTGNIYIRVIRGFGASKGLAGFPEEVWWMRIASGRGALGPGEKGFLPPSRKWAGGTGGPERERERRSGRVHTMDSSNYDPRREDEVGEEVPMSGGGSNDKQQQQRLMTLPTILTLGRVASVPLLVSTFHMDGRWATTATSIIFLAAAITDWLDGYIARKMRLGTVFGAFLDPVADKLMVAATLVLLCTTPLQVSVFGQVPWLLTVPSIAIIGREITMSAVREWAASQNSRVLEAVAVNNLGKWKTATQMTSLTILLATRDSSLSGSGVLVAIGVVLLYISSGLAIWSLAVYMKKIWRILLK